MASFMQRSFRGRRSLVPADGCRYGGGPPTRAVNPMRTRSRATDDLRLAIACLPRATRVAMLDGLARHPIIVGAYSTREGICPMLAAHRCGGRTNFIGFAEAWDRFAQRSMRTKRARRATEREILFLRAHLEASLMEDGDGPLAGAIADHRRLLETAARVRRDAAGRSDARVDGAVRAKGGAGTKGDDPPGR